MSFHFEGIDHIQLAAPKGCEQQARGFFADTLGLEEIEKPETLKIRGGVWFQCGNHQIHIGVQEDFVPAKKAHPAFLIKNIQALRGNLLEEGISVREDEALPGATRFYLDDPFGNRLEFLEWV